MTKQRWKRKWLHGSFQPTYGITNGYDGWWMGSPKCSDEESWDVTSITWHVVMRKDGSCHMDAAEGDGWFDDIDKAVFIWREVFYSNGWYWNIRVKAHNNYLHSWGEDVYDNSNTILLIDSKWFTSTLFCNTAPLSWLLDDKHPHYHVYSSTFIKWALYSKYHPITSCLQNGDHVVVFLIDGD